MFGKLNLETCAKLESQICKPCIRERIEKARKEREVIKERIEELRKYWEINISPKKSSIIYKLKTQSIMTPECYDFNFWLYENHRELDRINFRVEFWERTGLLEKYGEKIKNLPKEFLEECPHKNKFCCS
jgi:hypothetical protein